jgi:hypothetical protein
MTPLLILTNDLGAMTSRHKAAHDHAVAGEPPSDKPA